jgi:hypothetical protein
MTREEFIEKHASLFWYLPKNSVRNIDDEILVEFIFNYGSWESVKELCKVIGFQKLKEVYDHIHGRKKGNYIPEMYNLLGLLVKKYA